MRLLLTTITLTAAFALVVTASKPPAPPSYGSAMLAIVQFAKKATASQLPKKTLGFDCKPDSYDPKYLSCEAKGAPTFDQIKALVAYLASHGVPVSLARYQGQGQRHEYENNDWVPVDSADFGLTPGDLRDTSAGIWCDLSGTTFYAEVGFDIYP